MLQEIELIFSITVSIMVTFSLTLLITKSKILAGKREFVEQRYQSSKVGNQKPSWIHRIWRAIWTCPMCSGFWIGGIVAVLFPVYNCAIDVLVIFGVNWLLHCLEDVLFQSSKLLEKIFEEV